MLLLTNNNRGWGWSPDSAQIAYRQGVELWVAGADGTNPRLLTHNVRGWGWSPDGRWIWGWSPDGRWITYETDDRELWVASADGLNPRLLTDDVRGWRWSPDGKWITFYTDSRELWVASAGGTDHPRKITTFSRYYFSVSPITWEWSPYGDWLAYKNQDDRLVIGGEWWVVGTDGTQARKIEGSWSWSPE